MTYLVSVGRFRTFKVLAAAAGKPFHSRTVVTHVPVSLAYVEIDDPAYQSTKSPLLIFHGLFGSSQNWRSVGKALNAKLKRKVVLADLRNHGDSPHTSVMSFSEMAEDVDQLVSNMNPEKESAVLLGHSLGGLVCAYFALTKPNKVEKLIIGDVAPKTYFGSKAGDTPWKYIAMMKSASWKSDNIVEARREVNDQLEKTIQNAGIRQFLLTNLAEKGGKIGWRLNLDALEQNHDHLSTFPQEKLLGRKYEGQTLIIRGANSDYVTMDDAGLLDNFFPHWKMKTIEDAGHWVHSEQPAKFIDCVAEFLHFE